MKTRIVKKTELERIKRLKRTDSEKLKELRKSLGISQKELGKELGVPQSLISCIENGIKPAPFKLKLAVSNRLGVNFDGVESYDELMELWHNSQSVISNLKDELKELKEKLRELEN